MKAVVITRFGGPEVLEIQDVPKPGPDANEVRNLFLDLVDELINLDGATHANQSR